MENCEYIGSSHFKRKDFDSKIIGNSENLSSRSETLNASYSYLKEIKLKNINRVSIGQININSLRNKFEYPNSMVNGFLDILLVTEFKIDDFFPTAQFHIQRYSTPFRLDRNSHGGGILLYDLEDIPAKLINNINFDNDIEAMFIKINLRKKKWLLNVAYNPHKALIGTHLEAVGKNLDLCSRKRHYNGRFQYRTN